MNKLIQIIGTLLYPSHEQPTTQELVKRLIIKCRLLKTSGDYKRAFRTIIRAVTLPYANDLLRAEVLGELAECQIELNDWRGAQKSLNNRLLLLEMNIPPNTPNWNFTVIGCQNEILELKKGQSSPRRTVARTLKTFADDKEGALLALGSLLDAGTTSEGASEWTSEWRCRIWNAQASIYHQLGQLGCAIELARDAIGECWLIEIDILQSCLSKEISDNYDTFVESATKPIMLLISESRKDTKDKEYRHAFASAQEAFDLARAHQLADHVCASRALVARGVAKMGLGEYSDSLEDLYLAKKKLARHWEFIAPNERTQLDQTISKCRRKREERGF
jgi:hypothetical protein